MYEYWFVYVCIKYGVMKFRKVFLILFWKLNEVNILKKYILL